MKVKTSALQARAGKVPGSPAPAWPRTAACQRHGGAARQSASTAAGRPLRRQRARERPTSCAAR
eukprot:14693685-Alexandrium_andersonii.AAC.1